jgi:hypothetical protein
MDTTIIYAIAAVFIAIILYWIFGTFGSTGFTESMDDDYVSIVLEPGSTNKTVKITANGLTGVLTPDQKGMKIVFDDETTEYRFSMDPVNNSKKPIVIGMQMDFSLLSKILPPDPCPERKPCPTFDCTTCPKIKCPCPPPPPPPPDPSCAHHDIADSRPYVIKDNRLYPVLDGGRT